ncbi:hypothetical protein PMI38_04574 [Pseudomonas sp. GM84]|nr:hypothetical protein PMI38_04574 [Pseudomonas sp. GM84]
MVKRFSTGSPVLTVAHIPRCIEATLVGAGLPAITGVAGAMYSQCLHRRQAGSHRGVCRQDEACYHSNSERWLF